MLKSIYLPLVAILIFPILSDALYFHIGETERKCFIEEIPDETNVIGETYFRHVVHAPLPVGKE